MSNILLDAEQKIGPRLRRVRKRCGLTLDELAVQTGLTKGYLSKIEILRRDR